MASGLFLTWILVISLLGLMGYEVRFLLPVRGIFIGFLISLIVTQIAAIFPGRRAAGINIVEAIQCE